MNISGIDEVLKSIAGKIFEDFQSSYAVEAKDYYYLNDKLLVNALANARIDIDRVASFHSKSGADLYRQVAYIAKWMADIKPIQIERIFPRNLTNRDSLKMQRINAAFAVFTVDSAMLKRKPLSKDLILDLRYCFEFRHTMPADAIALILKHYVSSERK